MKRLGTRCSRKRVSNLSTDPLSYCYNSSIIILAYILKRCNLSFSIKRKGKKKKKKEYLRSNERSMNGLSDTGQEVI